ncbi:MAG: serine hydrolase domain-containing protein, partial [Verrucomicrobiota bacterium]
AEEIPDPLKDHIKGLTLDAESIVMLRERNGESENWTAGHIRRNGPEPDLDTLYEIGSITKVFTGVLLADLVLRKAIALDDPIGPHFPDGLLPADSPVKAITFEQLSTHTSGLPRIPEDLFEGADADSPYAHIDTARLYRSLAALTEAEVSSPAPYEYSNLGVGLLGHLIGLIHEKPYAEVVDEVIFSPLGMADSFVQDTATSREAAGPDQLATPHVGGEPKSHWPLAELSGAGAIVSSANDLARFARAHWDSETSPELAAALSLAREKRTDTMALGWHREQNGAVSHGGATGGFRAHLRVDPKREFFVIRLINNGGPATELEITGDLSPLDGYWYGYLGGIEGLFVYIKIESKPDSPQVTLHSPDQTPHAMPVGAIEFTDESNLSFEVPSVGGSFTGVLGRDQKLTGFWNQGLSQPLVLEWSEEVPERE